MTPEVCLVKVDAPIEDGVFRYLLGIVQEDRQKRILRHRIKQNADNMLIGDILAKALIKKVFEIPIKNQEFAYTEHGKPYLLDFSHIHFNISHSEEFVLCAVADKKIGVDIQKIRDYKPDLAKRVCCDAEIEHIEGSSDKASEFTRIWTQKEAALKMRGTGIAGGDIKNCLAGIDVRSERVENFWVSVVIDKENLR